ncbi:nickel ABC transporter ATP-binding protein NikE [Rhodococcus sp. B50]|uniref:nickel ABC transporter ATP-binding protein NikE n=1 Tax=Rhodococcus sp. B50 TaxID=2682847 RepID=UPI001BD33988|nr:ABC transporter ATP-binding protein [Rhodococcus sp. B50]MBS9376355.1 Glutathione import ATP-binding protein GsiA [Rhodococcus sp. B50]
MSTLHDTGLLDVPGPNTSERILSVTDLRIAFHGDPHDEPTVRDVSFDIAPGQVLALVGESGSGKSLTASALLGLLPPGAHLAGGSILFRSKSGEVVDLAGLSEKRLDTFRGSGIGMVFQNPLSSLDPSFRVGSQLDEVLVRHRPRRRRAERRELAAEWLRRVGFDDPERVLNSYPHELSGGMRQRVVLALAGLAEPALLVADEPTTALDTIVQRQVLDLLRDVASSTGASLLLITHDFDVVEHLADSVVVLRNGAVVESGTRDEVLSSPRDSYTKQLLAAVPRLGKRRSLPHWRGARSLSGGAVTQAVTEPVAVKSDPISPVLKLENVTRSFTIGGWGTGTRRSEFVAVDDVSLEVQPGEIYGLIGASGSGKSTLARLMGGLLDVTSGTVHFQGNPLSDTDRDTLRAARPRLQYVFQDPVGSLNPAVRVGEQIARPLRRFGTVPDKSGVPDAVAEALELVGLPTAFADRYPHSLSGGQAQRVCLARALALSPDLLILDEPTSALDVSTQAGVVDLVLDLRERLDLTCVFIGHGLGLVEWMCDRIGVMSRGCLVDTVPTQDLYDTDRAPEVHNLLRADLGSGKVLDKP